MSSPPELIKFYNTCIGGSVIWALLFTTFGLAYSRWIEHKSPFFFVGCFIVGFAVGFKKSDKKAKS
jgi:membrane protein DedA with SNARE-associated domain